jgi:ABC-2 type transport system ATP-binding protein
MAADPRTRPLAELFDVTVRFGSFTALDRVSFDVMPGEAVGLVGPNGAGKTTLLRVLATLLRPDGGRAEVAGHDVARQPRPVRHAIGYLPDFVGLYQDMRVVEYLRFFGDANGLGREAREEFVERALRMSGLADRAGDFIDQLSRGMRGKLAFVGVLAGDPPLLLLDEPLSGLDPLARTALRETLVGLRERDRSILISSHMLADLERFCDRILFIDRGQLVDEPTADPAALRQYQLVLAAADPADAERLRGIDGVQNVDVSTGGADAGLVLELAEDATAPAVLAAIVAGGFQVELWAPLGRSLEDRFRRAVEGGEP